MTWGAYESTLLLLHNPEVKWLTRTDVYLLLTSHRAALQAAEPHVAFLIPLQEQHLSGHAVLFAGGRNKTYRAITLKVLPLLCRYHLCSHLLSKAILGHWLRVTWQMAWCIVLLDWVGGSESAWERLDLGASAAWAFTLPLCVCEREGAGLCWYYHLWFRYLTLVLLSCCVWLSSQSSTFGSSFRNRKQLSGCSSNLLYEKLQELPWLKNHDHIYDFQNVGQCFTPRLSHHEAME
jgi:hypothetical protein